MDTVEEDDAIIFPDPDDKGFDPFDYEKEIEDERHRQAQCSVLYVALSNMMAHKAAVDILTEQIDVCQTDDIHRLKYLLQEKVLMGEAWGKVYEGSMAGYDKEYYNED